MRLPGRLCALAIAPFLIGVTGCVLSSSVRPTRLTMRSPESVSVHGAVKAHLVDGTIVVFPMGMRVVRNEAIGAGWRYAPTLSDSTFVHSFALDSVAVMETFDTEYDAGRSVLYSAILIGATYLTALIAAIALYACCSRGGT